MLFTFFFPRTINTRLCVLCAAIPRALLYFYFWYFYVFLILQCLVLLTGLYIARIVSLKRFLAPVSAANYTPSVLTIMKEIDCEVASSRAFITIITTWGYYMWIIIAV